MSRKTSFEKITAALTEHGWQWDVESTSVRVPDPESGKVIRDVTGRAIYTPTKEITAQRISATNGDGFDFEVTFDELGKYLADYTRGTRHPVTFGNRPSVKTIAEAIKHDSPESIIKRQEWRDQERQKDLQREAEQVQAAYDAAVVDRIVARSDAASVLVKHGLSQEQAKVVVDLLVHETFARVIEAEEKVEKAGRGYGLGKFPLGTYADGKPVESVESVQA